MIVLTIYVRSYCYLCEDMLQALRPLQPQLAVELDVIDIDGETRLEQQYGERIPVLAHGEHEICHYFLDEPALRQYIAKF